MMTDKEQIIIDGVDVSGCEYYAQGICNIPDVIETYDSCMDKGACYFKQLKRKEHELKTIREAFEIEYAKDEETGHIFGRSNKLLRKEQEYEELKARIETYSRMLENPEFKVALTDVRTGEREVWRSLGNKAQKYEQALDAIKSIVSSTLDCGEWIGQGDNKMENILDIINKAKDGK